MVPADLGDGEQDQPLTATVTATAAANGLQQRPTTAHNARTTCANWGYVRPKSGRRAAAAPTLTTGPRRCRRSLRRRISRVRGITMPNACLNGRSLQRSSRPKQYRQRSVKPSAQPTLVRTQCLPLPAKMSPPAAETRPGGRFLLVTPCIAVCHRESMRCGVHGRIADGARGARTVGAHRRLFTDGHGRAALAACFPA
jgi:hypothetical protein